MASRYVTKKHLIDIARQSETWDLPRLLSMDQVEGLPDIQFDLLSVSQLGDGKGYRCIANLARGCLIFDVPASMYQAMPYREKQNIAEVIG